MKKITPAHAEYVHIVQITDPHIFAENEGRFDDTDTAASLDAVIAAVNNPAQTPDLVLATGDLVHDAVRGAYTRLREKLQQLPAPVFCLPGNHDDPAIMHTMLNKDNVRTERVLACGPWVMIMLDSFLAGGHGGRLADAELALLQQQLEQTQGRQVLICLHHHPVPIASPWMDAMMLDNADAFFAIVDDYTHVRGILWGHIHQEFAQLRNNVYLFGSPSTCVQFKPVTEISIRDSLPPGYRELRFYPDGKIDTTIRWVTGYQAT